MAAKSVTTEYVDELIGRIKRGETLKKNTEISSKEFIKRMLPHVKSFVAEGFEYKEIAEFLGHVSAADLKKAVLKEGSDTPKKKERSVKAALVKASAKVKKSRLAA